MSEAKHSPETEIREQAALWFIRLTENDLSATERRAYLAWMRASGEHVGAILDIYRYHGYGRKPRLNERGPEPSRKIIDLSTRRFTVAQSYLAQDFALDHARRHQIPITLLAVVATVALALAIGTMDWQYVAIGVTLLLVRGLIRLKDHIVKRRVSSGRFGTTESEARDLIRFMVERAANDDFTDEKGRPRRALAPEVCPDAPRASLSGVEVPSK